MRKNIRVPEPTSMQTVDPLFPIRCQTERQFQKNQDCSNLTQSSVELATVLDLLPRQKSEKSQPILNGNEDNAVSRLANDIVSSKLRSAPSNVASSMQNLKFSVYVRLEHVPYPCIQKTTGSSFLRAKSDPGTKTLEKI